MFIRNNATLGLQIYGTEEVLSSPWSTALNSSSGHTIAISGHFKLYVCGVSQLRHTSYRYLLQEQKQHSSVFLCHTSNSWTFSSEGSGFAFKCLHFLGDCSSGNREFTDVHFASCKYLSLTAQCQSLLNFFFQQNQQEVSWLVKLEPTTITILFSPVVVFQNEKVQEVQRYFDFINFCLWWKPEFSVDLRNQSRKLSTIPSDQKLKSVKIQLTRRYFPLFKNVFAWQQKLQMQTYPRIHISNAAVWHLVAGWD